MVELVFIGLAGVLGFLTGLLKVRWWIAAMIGASVIPIFLVIADFAWKPTNLRYSGHIAGPVCMFLFVSGGLASAAGVGLARFIQRGK